MVLDKPLDGHVLESAYAKQAALNGAISTSAKGHYEKEVQREIEAIGAIGAYRLRNSVDADDAPLLRERRAFLESDQRRMLTTAYDLAMSSTIPNYVQTLNEAAAYFYELSAAHWVAEKAHGQKEEMMLKRQREEVEERQHREMIEEKLAEGQFHYRSL